jgi:hypothetical protein
MSLGAITVRQVSQVPTLQPSSGHVGAFAGTPVLRVGAPTASTRGVAASTFGNTIKRFLQLAADITIGSPEEQGAYLKINTAKTTASFNRACTLRCEL